MDYEKKVKKVEKENNALLEEFRQSMINAGLAESTVNKHLDNANFYINEFLLETEEVYTAAEGCEFIDSFLGDFFIRKCMWSTPSTIKTTASSLKKFYRFMLDKGAIDEEDYAFVCSEIKDNMAEWQEECARYNDPEDYDLW